MKFQNLREFIEYMYETKDNFSQEQRDDMSRMIKIGMDAKSKSINNKLKETKSEF